MGKNLGIRDENKKIMSSNENIDMSDVEARKIIEREIKPYLSIIKKELQLKVEEFTKNVDEKIEIINDITELKNEIEKIKSVNELIKNNFEEKILKNSEEIILQNQKLNNIQNKLNQLLSWQQSNQNNQISAIEISQIKEKINLLEKNNENVLPEFQQVAENTANLKFKECSEDIKKMKRDNEDKSIKNGKRKEK